MALDAIKKESEGEKSTYRDALKIIETSFFSLYMLLPGDLSEERQDYRYTAVGCFSFQSHNHLSCCRLALCFLSLCEHLALLKPMLCASCLRSETSPKQPCQLEIVWKWFSIFKAFFSKVTVMSSLSFEIVIFCSWATFARTSWIFGEPPKKKQVTWNIMNPHRLASLALFLSWWVHSKHR